MNYFIVLKLDKSTEIEVGKLGLINFKKGYYIYAGSAKRGFSKRVKRHFNKNKKLRWHIDYLTTKAEVVEAYRCLVNEHEITKLASQLMEGIKNFGCSDCKCYSHLYYSSSYPSKFIKEAKNLNYIVERLNYEEL